MAEILGRIRRMLSLFYEPVKKKYKSIVQFYQALG